MIKLKNDSLLRAIWHEPLDSTPVWIMRQAGRYLPEYRQVREKAGSFLALCKTPELACEVTLQPLRRYALDASIVFSDILTIPDAMGLGLGFQEGEGPYFERPLRRLEDIKQLRIPEPEVQLSYVLDAIRLIQQELNGKVPLIGFCGSPWTLASYMVEGKSKTSFSIIQDAVRNKEPWLHLLLDKLAQAVSLHLNAQIAAGVQVVMLFDTWGSILGDEAFREYSLRYTQQTLAHLNREYQGQRIPVIFYTRGNRVSLLADAGCDVLGVDAQVNLRQAREKVGPKLALQGNLDPTCLLQSPEAIRAKVAEVLADFGSGSGHVFNLGQGITPDIPPEHVAVLVDAVHELSRAYHSS
jgi:uroporphyrinogen decarboxylase